MKIKTILLLLLSAILSNNVYADDTNYTISSDKKTITVTGDCTIPLEKFAPSTLPIYGDGEHGGVGQQGNDLFKTKTNNLNPSIRGIDFKRDNKKAKMIITFANLQDNQTVTFYHAKSDSLINSNGSFSRIDWSPDDRHKFSISVQKTEAQQADEVTSSLALTGETLPNDIEHTLLLRTDSLSQEMASLRNQLKKGGHDYFDWKIVSGTIILFLAIFFLLYRHIQSRMKILDKENSLLSEDVYALHIELDKFKKAAQQQSKEQTPPSLLNKEIKEFIVSQINALQGRTPSPIHSNPTTENVQNLQKVKDATKSIDTERVKYNPSDNSFTIEESETHIFRIYSQNESVFYTIVDNSDIRTQLGAMLQAFEGCITYQPPTLGASRIEPVNPGVLTKDGERFLVEKKLEIKFV